MDHLSGSYSFTTVRSAVGIDFLVTISCNTLEIIHKKLVHTAFFMLFSRKETLLNMSAFDEI